MYDTRYFILSLGLSYISKLCANFCRIITMTFFCRDINEAINDMLE